MVAVPEELDLSVLIMAAKDASNMLAIEERLRYNLKNAVSKGSYTVFRKCLCCSN